jgi:transcriptional regulator with XRE-family HTH domain
MDNSPKEIASQLKEFLAKSRLTQQALQKKIGIPQSQISRVTRGQFQRLTPNVKTLCEFANIQLKDVARKRDKQSEVEKLIDGIVGGSQYRQRLVIKLLKTGALLASGDTRSRLKSRNR